MDLATETRGEVTIVKVEGDVNGVTCGRLEEALGGMISDGRTRIVLDLQDVRYISSAGLRVLLTTTKRLGADGGFALSRPGPAVRQVLDVTGFSAILPLYEDLEAAVQAASP